MPTTHRWGVSLLSKENFADAFNEEVMIDKNTGEVLVKTPSGDTISYNYNSRLSSHVNATRIDANNYDIYGDIINISLDSTTGVSPFVMESGVNYIKTPIELAYNCKRLMIHSDIDGITENVNGFSSQKNNMILKIGIALKYSDGTLSDTATISNSVDIMNNKIYHLQDNSIITLNTTKRVEALVLQSITLDAKKEEFGNPGTTTDITGIRPICNSIFMVLET